MAHNRDLLQLTAEERQDLEQWAQSRTLPAGDVFRARIILALAEGPKLCSDSANDETSSATIWRWRLRFEQSRMAGLEGRHQGSKPRDGDSAVLAKVIRRVQHKAPDGSTHWSRRKLAEELGVSKWTVQRILAQAKLQPHRVRSEKPIFTPLG